MKRMTLQEILIQKREDLIEKWFESILATYPKDSRSFFKKQKNRFANPMGHNIHEGVCDLFDVIVNEACNAEKADPFLDRIIRIRAIQDFSPSQAIVFIFDIKRLIRETVSTGGDPRLAEEMALLERSLDEMALQAFDVYMRCREKLFELRVNEVRNLMIGALERANLVSFTEKSEEGLNENQF